MLIGVSTVWFVVAPLLAGHYAVAIFALTRLAYCKIPVWQYVIWNVVILFAPFVGSVVFLVYYFKNKKRLRAWENIGEITDNDKIDKTK